MRYASVFLITCTALAAMPQAKASIQVTPLGLAKAKEQLVTRLHARNFFRAGACGEILETSLSMLKMPAVGTGASRSEQARANRAGEFNSRPKMKDELLNSDSWSKVALSTQPQPNSDWSIRITRTDHANDTFESFFTFSTKQNGDRLECDLKSVRFSRKTAKGFEAADTNDCLDAIVLDQSDASNPQIANRIQRDCIFAIHYSNQARLFAAKEKAK